MSQRERTLSILLLIGICVIGGAFFGYQFILSPMRDADRQINELTNDIHTRTLRKLEIEEKKEKFYEPMRKLSLPSDIILSGREYESQLSALLRRSEFQAGAYTITPGPPDSKNSPTIGPKKPAYTRLTYVITGKGELHSIADFLDRFYRQPLLHQIRSFSITRSGRAVERRSGGREELEVNIKVEALVLDNAENRSTLIHVPPPLGMLGGNLAGIGGVVAVTAGRTSPYDLPRGKVAPEHQMGRLAVPSRDYAAITGRNVFFGPPPPERKRDEKDDTPKEPDLGPFIRLTALSDADGVARAHLFDFYNKYDFYVEQTASGITVEGHWYSGEKEDRKRMVMRTREAQKGDLEFGTRDGGNYVRLRVMKIADGDMFVQLPEDDSVRDALQAAPAIAGGVAALISPGKIYKWHIGQLMNEMVQIRNYEAREVLAGVLTLGPAARVPR
jgi:hypothetical protein